MIARVELDRAGLADALDLALLQRRSSLACSGSGIRRHFVDEQRAAVGQLEAADAAVDSRR